MQKQLISFLMLRYVVFLRAINVSNQNIITNEKLKEVFTSLGFKNVLAHKQSGNIIICAESANPLEIERQARQKLRLILSNNVNVFVRTPRQLLELLETNPFKDEQGMSFLVTFLPKEPTDIPFPVPTKIRNAYAKIILIKGSEVFSVVNRVGDGGKINPFIESKLKVKTTTRNWNILKEIGKKYFEKNPE
jgi:uncharacterized protein (DUF1697 family)